MRSDDPIDVFLELGSTSDWVSPLWGMAQDMVSGEVYRFYIDRNSGWSLNAIKRLLINRGIRVWNDFITDDMLVFSVSPKQANWAKCVMQQSGILVLGDTQKKVGLLTSVLKWFWGD